MRKVNGKKEKVFITIRNRIYAGHYWPREKLVETVLSEEMNVSRTVIREVIKDLAAKDLVQILPNKGAFVAELSYRRIKEMIQLESILEGSAAYLAAKHLNSDQLKEIRNLWEESTKEKTSQAWPTYNKMFHRLIITACGNSRLVDVIRENISFLRYWFIQTSLPEEIGARNLSHYEILKALESKNALLSRDLMEEHVLGALEELLSRIQENNPNLLLDI